VLAVVLLPCYRAHLAAEAAFQSHGAYQHMDADEDMSEEAPAQRANDDNRMQERLRSILRRREAT